MRDWKLKSKWWNFKEGFKAILMILAILGVVFGVIALVYGVMIGGIVWIARTIAGF